MSNVAVVLAVEPGEGFDTSKYLEPVRGKALIETVVDAMADWPVDEIVVVLGSDADEIVASVDLSGATIIIDPGWEEGAASPMRAALDLVTRDRSLEQVLLVRGDQAGVQTSTVEALIEKSVSSGADAVIPKYRYARGWPVVVGQTMWDRFLSLEGDLDVHDVIATHAASIDEVWVDHLEPLIVMSIDDLTRRGM